MASLRRLLLAQASDSVALGLVTGTVSMSHCCLCVSLHFAVSGVGSHWHRMDYVLRVPPLQATMGAAEAFGQSEALTTRLRHIIQDYPEGPGT